MTTTAKINEHNLARIEKLVSQLNRRAKRVGQDQLRLAVGAPIIEPVLDDEGRPSGRVRVWYPCTLGGTGSYAG